MSKLNKKLMVLVLFIITLSIISFSSATVYAEDSEYDSNLTKEQIEDIFSLKVENIADPWTWISEAKTFVIAETKDNHVTYWWNVPNIQMSAQNSLYGMIAMSGYGTGAGTPAENNKWLIDVGKRDDANTALKKYGFRIPSPTYIGERPLITISVAGVLIPDSVTNTAGRLWDLVWEGDIVSAPTDKDLNSLIYIAPRDYETSGITFERWVKDNWYKAIDKIKDGQVLISTADDKGIADGKLWIKKKIIDDQGLAQKGLDAKHICQELQRICGKYYPDVAKNIILASGIGKTHQTERIMPYDLSRMNSKDAKIFKGLKDPRAEMQQSFFSTGYDKLVFGMFKSSILSLSGTIAELTVALNGFSNWTFLENVGISPMDLWNNSIIQVLITIMFVIFVAYVLRSAFKVLTGNGGYLQLAGKALCTFLVAIFVFNISYNTDNTYKFFKDTSVKIFNLSNVTFQTNQTTSKLLGTGTAADKENVQLWLPYFNTWTSYHTNHTLMDSEQIIDKNSGKPEVKNLISPKIDTVEQNLWSTVLADSFTENTNYSGNIYRVVDHFMSPRISGTGINLTVKQNENYNGNIQSNINFSSIPFQILILLLVVLKVLLFFEFVFNIAMLLFRVALTLTDKFKLGLVIKELGASMLNVAFMNIIIGLVIWSSLIADGWAGLCIVIFYYFIGFNLIKTLAMSNSVFTPKFFRSAQKVFYPIKQMFERQV